MEKINKRQKAIYDFIKERINDKGIAPSVREIGEAVGASFDFVCSIQSQCA